MPNEEWENYQYHLLFDWALYSLFFACLGPNAQRALYDNLLEPERCLKGRRFNDYLASVYRAFDRVPISIPPHVDDDTPAIEAIRYLYI